jgi:2-keto-4-pentenoate hydratase
MSRELTAAQLIATTRQARTALAPLPDACRPETLDDGYSVQEVLHGILAERRTGNRIGYKIGCTTKTMQDNLGIGHPCGGSVSAEDVHHGRAELQLGNFVNPGVECEIGVIMARDLDPARAPFDRAAAAEFIEAVMPAIEIVDNRYQGGPAIGVPTLVADDFFGAGAVLGTPVKDWQELDLAGLTGRVSVNGEVRDSGTGAAVMGHPLEAVAWFANLKAERGEILKAGEFILTGSLTVVQWIDGPSDVEIDIEKIGKVSVGFR